MTASPPNTPTASGFEPFDAYQEGSADSSPSYHPQEDQGPPDDDDYRAPAPAPATPPQDSIVGLDEVRIAADAIRLKQEEIRLIEVSALGDERKMQKLSKANADLARLTRAYDKAARKPKPQAAAEIDDDAEAMATYGNDKLEAWRMFLQRFNYLYVQHGNKYVLKHPDGSYKAMMPCTLWERHSEFLEEEDKQLFKTVMEDQCRMFDEAVMTFGEVKPWQLNLMSREHWVKAAPGDFHELFDILLCSLGGGKPENIRHLEQCLVWKFLHPHDYLIPTPVIFGEGEVGKNFFFEEVLSTLVGDQQVAIVEVDNALGNFSGMLLGKTFVLLNEAIKDSVNMEKFKAKTAAKTINVNEKYGLQMAAAATAWIWCGGNGISGGVALANDKSDRRWSVIRVQPGRSLNYWISEFIGIHGDTECRAYIQANRHHLSDRAEVGAWMHSLIEKHKDMEFRPMPLHGADFDWLMDQQRKSWEELASKLFSEPGFTHIHAPTLYKMYGWYHKEVQPATGMRPLRKKDFYIHLDEWLEKHHPDITRRPLNVMVLKKQIGRVEFYSNITAGVCEANNASYEIKDDHGRVTGYRIPGETLTTGTL